MKGTIKKVITDKGFGFITPDGGGKDIFFHASNLGNSEFDSLREGQVVEFSTGSGPKGPRAENVMIQG